MISQTYACCTCCQSVTTSGCVDQHNDVCLPCTWGHKNWMEGLWTV